MSPSGLPCGQSSALALEWFGLHAEGLDLGSADPEGLVPELGRQGLFGIGVPASLGGAGGSVVDAMEAIADVAEHSLTAAFVFWGQRSFIEYLLQSPNQALGEYWLPRLLKGQFAGATGLSNAMKYLCGVERLQINASPSGSGWRLEGALPWVTNLRKGGFVVAAAAERGPGEAPAVFALSDDLPGLERNADLDLLALRGSNTASIDLASVEVGHWHLIHGDAVAFLPQVRPAFLGLQCGMSIGLARASLRAARHQAGRAHHILLRQIAESEASLDIACGELQRGLVDGRYARHAAPLFRLRIRLAELVQAALELELEASGGRAYLLDQNRCFARRWREAAFIPVVTPSLAQIKAELAKCAAP